MHEVHPESRLTFVSLVDCDRRKAAYHCECGNETIAIRTRVKTGLTLSCGCYRLEQLRAKCKKPNRRSENGGRTRSYGSWLQMRTRCNNPVSHAYDRYGGRGVTICEQWNTSFDAFFADMGECPPGLTIERIDNNGNYEPGNCRWATYEDQANNKRNNVTITYNGITKTQRQWAEELGVTDATLTYRRNRGWPVEKILTPARHKGGRGGSKKALTTAS